MLCLDGNAWETSEFGEEESVQTPTDRLGQRGSILDDTISKVRCCNVAHVACPHCWRSDLARTAPEGVILLGNVHPPYVTSTSDTAGT